MVGMAATQFLDRRTRLEAVAAGQAFTSLQQPWLLEELVVGPGEVMQAEDAEEVQPPTLAEGSTLRIPHGLAVELDKASVELGVMEEVVARAPLWPAVLVLRPMESLPAVVGQVTLEAAEDGEGAAALVEVHSFMRQVHPSIRLRATCIQVDYLEAQLKLVSQLGSALGAIHLLTRGPHLLVLMEAMAA